MPEVIKYVGPEGRRVVIQIPDPEPVKAKKPARKKAAKKEK